METIEQPVTELKPKKKPKKKKGAKLNNNHQNCENEEKFLENGVSTEKIIQDLTNDIEDLHLVKRKNGFKLVNGVHNEPHPSSQPMTSKIEQKVDTTEEDTAIIENNNLTGATTSKKPTKKKKNKKQNAKGPDKIETNVGQEPSEFVDTNDAAVIANGSTDTSEKEPSKGPVQMLSQEVSTKPIIVDVTPKNEPKIVIEYKEYESELQMPDIMQLIQKDLSEPYSIYTYRYFIHNWPKLCFLAMDEAKCVGAIVCKLDMHKMVRRGYIAMLAVDKDYRKMKIGTTLVQKAIEAMLRDKADEVVLETEITNQPALRLYENLGFVRDKRLFHYYLNGVDALRLKLWFR